MVNIKKDRYKIRFKAYITYSYDEKIAGIFLENHYDKISRIKLGDDSIDTTISKELADFIISEGGTVEKAKVLRYRGKRKVFGIPVEIKNRNNELVIRLVGKTREKLFEDIEEIKKELLDYGVKPTKVCSWRRLEDFDEGKDDEDIEEIETNEDNNILEIPRIDKKEDNLPEDIVSKEVEAENIMKEEEKEEADKIDVENINKEVNNKCPDCGSTNLKELLHTPSGIRTKCLDCEEIFVKR